MQWLKFIFIFSLVVIFDGTSFIAIFGAGKVLTALFKAYVFKAETCEYKPVRAVKIPASEEGMPSQTFEEPERTCEIDYNRAKDDIAEGLAMFIISTPIAVIFFKKLKVFYSANYKNHKTAFIHSFVFF